MTTTTIDLDRQRAEFEEAYFGLYPSAVHANPSKFERDESGDYIDAKVFVGWDIWKAALASRSNAGEAAAQVEAQAPAEDELLPLPQPVSTVEAWVTRDYGRKTSNEELETHGEYFTAEQMREYALANRSATQQAARAQQEPVAWMTAVENGFTFTDEAPEQNPDANGWHWTPLYAAPVAQQSEATLQRMRAAFHTNMLRAYPDKTHEEIAAEIDKAIGVQPTEAVAPTAAANTVNAKLPCNYVKSGDRYETFHVCTVCGDTSYNGGERTKCEAAIEQLKKAGRESAAPAAPVDREGAQQDAKDAARYRWLRDMSSEVCAPYIAQYPEDAKTDDGIHPNPLLGEEADKAVDAAMQKGAQ